jgi:hypothetical protein
MRIMTAVRDMGVAINNCSGSCSVGHLRVQRSVNERRLLED